MKGREWTTMEGPRDRGEGRWTMTRYVSPTPTHTGRKGVKIQYEQAGGGSGGGKSSREGTSPATTRV